MSKVAKPSSTVDIEANLSAFFEHPAGNYCLQNERNASFDYCYNYFQGFRDRGEICQIASNENLEMSCLQIGFYLASWGMLRGSSFLSQKSAAHYADLIQLVAKIDQKFWEIDVENYAEENVINRILTLEEQIRECVNEGTGKERIASETLTTKIMLGIFGNIPAFDSYFLKGFGNYYVNKASLEKIYEFYMENRKTIDRQRINTIKFPVGKVLSRPYTQAKIIDMVFFMEGDKKFKTEIEAEKIAKVQNKA